MPKFILMILLWLPGLVLAETIEIDIHGMSCSFCVEGLQDELSQLPDIDRVDVSLKSKKVRIVSKNDPLDRERIKRAIVDAGYTPMEIRNLESPQD